MAQLVEQRDLSALPPNTAVCLGAFDGLHRGHQALIERARGLGQTVGLVTFDPHPLQVLAPERAPRLLHTDLQRRRVCASLGITRLVLFTTATGFVIWARKRRGRKKQPGRGDRHHDA